jgi:hypothetical protein
MVLHMRIAVSFPAFGVCDADLNPLLSRGIINIRYPFVDFRDTSTRHHDNRIENVSTLPTSLRLLLLLLLYR